MMPPQKKVEVSWAQSGFVFAKYVVRERHSDGPNTSATETGAFSHQIGFDREVHLKNC
jgi:hypothetical protein